MTETHSEVNRGWFFPASIIKLYDEGILNSGEIILLGIINSLCHVEKGCWASNSYLAEKWGKTPFHTSRAIGKFLSLELLETEIKKGNRRVIWPTFAGDRLLKRAIAVAEKSKAN